MIEANSPIDVSAEQIKKHKETIENMLVGFTYQGKQSLPALMMAADPDEKYIMSDIERDVYLTIREGMCIFKEVRGLLTDKIEYLKKVQKVLSSQLVTDPELKRMREFSQGYATFVSSKYISKKLEELVKKHAGFVELPTDTEGLDKLQIDFGAQENAVIGSLLIQVYDNLLANKPDPKKPEKKGYESPYIFPLFVKDLFSKFAEIAAKYRGSKQDLEKNLEGYQFRVMDGFVALEGYNDRSMPTVTAVKQDVAFQPIRANEIVGNRSAKRKVHRYIQRLVLLYDLEKQTSPILELGGLAWSSLYDGLPGTGKTSLFRYAMTLFTEYSNMLGRKHAIFQVDQSVKDEFYGKTGKILLQRLAVTQDPTILSLGIFDDIDLLTSTRDDAQGADNDINNILMQYFDGAFTFRRGNVINFSASNKPTGVDDALRNRFNDRILIDGPTTAEDFADVLLLNCGKIVKKGLLVMENGYTPFASQDVQKEGGWTGGDVAAYMADNFAQYKKSTIIDFGTFMADLKKKNPKITGRSAKAITEAIKERSADFDLPNKWFTDQSLFLGQSYERKVDMLAELYHKITPDVLFQEAQRYFDSEERFAVTEAEGHITSGYNSQIWGMQSELKFLQEQISKGEKADILKLTELRHLLSVKEDKKRQIIIQALHHAEEEERRTT